MSTVAEARAVWLKTLRAPGAKKTTQRLESPKDTNARCCLGHACHALGVERKVVTEGFPGGYQGPLVRYGGEVLALPRSVAKQLDISPLGAFRRKVYVEGASNPNGGMNSLVGVNDDTVPTSRIGV